MSPAVQVTANSGASSSKGAAKARTRSTRVVRRRGRGRLDGLDSDEEFERDAMSDGSESPLSESESLSDSESEVESTALNGLSRRADTPSTTQSPPPEALTSLKPKHDEVAEPPRSTSAFFTEGSASWSDMMADETGNEGPAEVPVIDFAELRVHTTTSSPRSLAKEEPAATSVEISAPTSSSSPPLPAATTPAQSRGRGAAPPKRALGHVARQQYQQRLQSDPSFVPTVGEFWGHDPRLIPEDMRPMSDWWRDRKFARGRGRGMFVSRGMRGRGHGGFVGYGHVSASDASDDPNPTSSLLPIEKEWTHDGFEEMKRREEKRKAERLRIRQQQQEQIGRNSDTRGDVSPSPVTGSRGRFLPGRGRGFVPAGRGFPRRHGYPFAQHTQGSITNKVWYTIKPDRMWTKQLETFLHYDSAGKPWSGKLAGYRIRLPGKGPEFVKKPAPATKQVPAAKVLSREVPSESTVTTARGKSYIVRIPSHQGLQKALPNKAHIVEHPETFTVTIKPFNEEGPPVLTSEFANQTEEASIASSSAVQVQVIEAPSSADSSLAFNGTGVITDVSSPLEVMATPGLSRDNSFSDNSASDAAVTPQATTVDSALDRKPDSGFQQPPQLPPLQTMFSPAQPSPTYGSPYAYPAQLPPGVALNPQGYPYEVASGRPVFLQTPTPPMPLYNPRPMHHPLHPVSHHQHHNSIPFVPGHMHHASLPQDFLPIHPHTPPVPNGFMDPQIGAPLFSLARQSSRVEIRAPSDQADGTGKGKGVGERKPSGLRSTTVANEGDNVVHQARYEQPGSAVYPHAPDYYASQPQHMYGVSPDGVTPTGSGAQQPAMDGGMMGYNGYQQYYYPEYGYNPYMLPVAGTYDAYPPDPSQPTVYY